jgi:methionyl-tRNA synthetase
VSQPTPLSKRLRQSSQRTQPDQIAQRRWYVTTAIPYVNARPHIGFALECIQTDSFARFHRQLGDDVFFLTGTDENSLKNAQAAEREGIPTQALVDRNAEYFRELRDTLELSFDDFIRTSVDPRHLAGVRKLWEACDRRGDIYKKPYSGLYCVGCEQFYTEAELDNGLCPEHHTRPELVEEENYFFRLSRYQDELLRLVESDELRIVPQTRKNEVTSFIRRGLADFSISRSRARARDWGIGVPGDPSQVMYVWFDALGNYITALGYADEGALYQRYWVNGESRVHVIGKGIVRFHAIYWPAMLLSAGVPLPTTIFVHSYVTIGREKIGKSLGNVVDPGALVGQYGAEALRYYLLREIPAYEDGDFTLERFQRAYNADLADQLGNLLNRTLSMVTRYYGGVVPAAAGEPPAHDRALIAAAQGVPGRVEAAMARFDPQAALEAIWELVGHANKYVAEVEPWTLAKRRKAEGDGEAERRLASVLYNLVETLRLVTHYLAPFLPSTSAAIVAQLGTPTDASRAAPAIWTEQTLRWGGYPAGTHVQPGGVLFPKLETPAAVE